MLLHDAILQTSVCTKYLTEITLVYDCIRLTGRQDGCSEHLKYSKGKVVKLTFTVTKLTCKEM